jgi:hypothetical protein
MLRYSEDDRINFHEIFTHPVMSLNYNDAVDSVFLRLFSQPDKKYLIEKDEFE